MGGSWGEVWWYGGDFYDRRQDRRHEASLDELRSSQRRETQRLHAQLQRVQGSLDQRVTRLAAAFDAFVEMSDLREELRVFQPAVMVRYRVRRLLAATAVARETGIAPGARAEPDGDGGVPDVPGYWLAPAGAALAATLEGDVAAAEAATVEARDRDPVRTDAFLCAAFALAGRPAQAAGRLGSVLALRVDAPVTRMQQILWHAAADGAFGEAGRLLVEERLVAAVASAPPELVGAEVTAWRSVVERLPGRAGPPRPKHGIPDVFGAPVRAAARLDALRGWAEPRLAPRDAQPGDEQPPPSGEATTAPPDPLVAVVEDLVDEGAPDERPLMERVAELRRIIEADGGTPPRPGTRWDDPVGELLPAVRAESADAPTVARRSVATRAVVPFLRAVADQLVAEGVHAPPEEVEVRVDRHRIRYRDGYPVPASADAARAANDKAATRPASGVGQVAVAGGAGGLLLLAGAIAGAPVLAIVGLLVLVGGALLHLTAQSDARRAEEFRVNERERLDQEIARTAAVIGELRSQARAAVEKTRAARAGLDAVLPLGAETVGATQPAGSKTQAAPGVS